MSRLSQARIAIGRNHCSRFALAQRLIEKLGARDGRKWSQAHFLEAAIPALAKAEKLGDEV
jgi:hypothetical protein